MHLLLRPYQRLQTRIFLPEGPQVPQLATQARRAISSIRAGEEIVPDGREPIAQPILPDVSQWKPPGNNCCQHPWQWWKEARVTLQKGMAMVLEGVDIPQTSSKDA